MSNIDKKTIPVEPADIEDAVRRLWRLDEFLEEFIGLVYDNTDLPEDFRWRVEQLYKEKF